MSDKNNKIIYLLTFPMNPITRSIFIMSIIYIITKSFDNYIYNDFQRDVDLLRESQTPVTIKPLLTIEKLVDFIVPNDTDSELVGVTKGVGIIILGLGIFFVLGCIIDSA